MLAALRRLVLLVLLCSAVTVAVSALLGLLAGAGLDRSISLGFYAVGCFLMVSGFFVGNRGPVRTKGDPHPFMGPRFLRWATPEEHQSTIAESAIFLVLGIILIIIGLAVDSRYRLV